jgi:competence protein ComEC
VLGAVAVLDVGQGSAAVVISDGSAMVVDCARHLPVLAALDSAAIAGPLDLLVLTHRDLDHIRGAFQLLQARGAEKVCLNRAFALDPSPSESPMVKSVLLSIYGWLDENPGRQAEMVAGMTGAIGHAKWTCLWPSQHVINLGTIGQATPNQTSIVLLTDIGGRRFLMLSDLESADVLAVVTANDVHADVVVLSHHGAAAPELGEALEFTQPSFCIASSGRGNPYGHPRAESVSAVTTFGARIMCTQASSTCNPGPLNSPHCAGSIEFQVGLEGQLLVEPDLLTHAVRIASLESPMCSGEDVGP